MQAQRRDANESSIVEALRRAGCAWIAMDKSAGFDGVVVSPVTGTHIFEIKDPAKRWKLTQAEEKRRAEIEAAGGAYRIVLTISEALEIVGRQ